MTYRMLLRSAALSLILIIPLGIYVAPGVVADVATVVLALSPLWLPVVLFFILAPLWLLLVRSQYVASVPYVLLEVVPGERTPTTARAMEYFFYALYQRITISRRTELLTGAQRMPWSFELAAHNGVVRFFIYIPQSDRRAVELRLRSEYRDIDINEARDYARELVVDPLATRLTVREFALAKPDPYPLKTYEEYEKAGSETPFAKLLEHLVSFGSSEHCFISLIVRPHQRARLRFLEPEVDTLHADAYEEIAKIVGKGGDPRALPTDKQKVVAAIEDGLKKPSFDCGLRVVYAAPRETFQESRVADIESLFSTFGDKSLNMFVAYNPTERVTWPLSDVFSALPWLSTMYTLHLYRRRIFFTPPYYGKAFILNTAELATLFHLPHIRRSSVLARARGKRLEPPDNLPVTA